MDTERKYQTSHIVIAFAPQSGLTMEIAAQILVHCMVELTVILLIEDVWEAVIGNWQKEAAKLGDYVTIQFAISGTHFLDVVSVNMTEAAPLQWLVEIQYAKRIRIRDHLHLGFVIQV
jgi:hypothetical protein